MFEIKVGSEYLSRNGKGRFRVLAMDLFLKDLPILALSLKDHSLWSFNSDGRYLWTGKESPGDLYWYAHDAEGNPSFRPEGEGEMLLKNGDVIEGRFRSYNWGIPSLFPERAIIGYRPAGEFRKAHGKTFQLIGDLLVSEDGWTLHTGWDTAPDLSKKVEVLLENGNRIVPLEARLLNWGIQSEEGGVIVMWRYVHGVLPKAEEEVKGGEEEEIFFRHYGKGIPDELDLNDLVDVKLRNGTILRRITSKSLRWYYTMGNREKEIVGWKK